jgi:hypothetical protein
MDIRRCATTIEVQCWPLLDLLVDAGVTQVDFMKLDIEGFEHTVLSQFFADAKPGSPLRPRHVLLEVAHSEREGRSSLIGLMQQEGYGALWQANGNALFAQRR